MSAATIGLTQTYQKYISNFLWLVGARVITSVFALVVTAVVARHLGPTDFGLLAYTFSLATLFAIVGHLGLDGLIVRELSSKPDEAPRVLGTVIVLKTAAYFFAATALLAFGFLVPSHTNQEVMLLYWAAAFVALTPLTTIFNWFHARVQARYVSIASSTGALASGTAKLLLVWIGAGVVAFAAANLINVVVAAALGMIFFYLQYGPSPRRWTYSAKSAKEMLSEGWMIFLGSIFAIIYLKIDQVMLRWLVGPEEVGVYAVAAQLSEAAYIIPSAIVVSVFPKLVELRADNEAAFHVRLQQVFDVLILAALPVVLGVLLLGRPLIDVLFGEAYRATVPILMVHILAAPFIFMRFAFSRWILIEKFAIFSLITQGLGAFMNVALNLALIPHFSGLGAAIATVVSYATASYLALLVLNRTRPIFFMMSRSMFMPWRAAGRVLTLAEASR